MFTNSERKIFDNIQHMYEMCAVAKTFVDPTIIFLTLKLFGATLMHLNYFKWAVDIFTVMRDLGYEFLNWSFTIQSFDYLGRVLQKQAHYKDSIIAYKKMLQLAWVTDSQEYEVRAYFGLARQYFYEQNVQRSQFYTAKALCSELEPQNSSQRRMAIEQFKKYINFNEHFVELWERLGYTMKRTGFDKVVNGTQTYDEAFILIRQF